MRDERITITVRIGSSGSVCIDSDREISGYKHTVFTNAIMLRYNEVIRNSFIYRWSHRWSLQYFTNENRFLLRV